MTAKGDQKRDPAEEAEKLIASMQISAPTMMAQNVVPGNLGKPEHVQTNVFGVTVRGNNTIFIYDVRMFADLSPTKTVEFTKKGKDDCTVNERKEKCVHILEQLMEQNNTVFSDKYRVYYDGQSMLFTLDDILPGDEKFKRFSLPGSCFKLTALKELDTIIVEIKACSEKRSFILNSETMCSSTANLDISRNDRYLTQFVEIVLKQHAIMSPHRHKVYEYGKSFMTNPLREGLEERDIKEVGDGKRLLVGSKQSVRQIEGPNKRGMNNISLVIDAKKTAFHMEQTVAAKAEVILKRSIDRPMNDADRERINGVIKGLFVETTHLKNNKRMALFGLSKSSSVESFFENEGTKISVCDYYSKKYNIHLKHPTAPVLLAKERGQMNCYPMEVCKVVPYQRVTIPQQTPEQSQQSTRECAVPPAARQRYIMAGCNALEVLNEGNLYIKNAGLKVYPNPVQVTGRALPSPGVLYKRGAERVEMGKWKTQGTQYLIPAEVATWAVYHVQDRCKIRYTINDIQQFAKKFYDECNKKGMKMAGPTEIQIIAEKDVEERIKTAAAHSCQFILFVASDMLADFHKNMKYWERKYECLTQQINVSNMDKIMRENKFMTLENIINKTNCKLGGVNYGLEVTHLNGVARKWFTDDRLILGIALSHPPPTAAFSGASTMPTVVGFSANMKNCPYEFIGDFALQDSRKSDTVHCISDIVKQAVERHANSHKRPAKELVIYRTGIDEGAFDLVLTKEIPVIKATLKKMGVDCKISFISAAKVNSDVRLMRQHINPTDKGPKQNIPPGVVVDHTLTHPAYFEFYLNSHTTLQGSAKSPRYTVVYDELNLTCDEIEGLTFALAHNHQIVALTTSLPCPLYIAQRYAERGHALFKSHTEKSEAGSDNSSGFEDASRKLTFKDTKLAHARINA